MRMVTARRRRYPVVLLLLVLLGGCASGHPAPHRTTPSRTSSSPVGAGPYRQGDCVELPAKGGVAKIGCDRPHEYEVTRSGRLPANVSSKYPPPVSTMVRPICRSALPTYLRSADADASRLETVSFWPTQAQWNNGDRWFACLLTERGIDNEPVRRTGSLAGALANGLGAFQRCQVDKPLADGALRVVPCDRPHRSEAVPGVLVLGTPTDPPPDPTDMVERYVNYCTKAVNSYLGGEKPGVTPSSVGPLPQDWPTGTNTLVCFAVTKTAVTGSLRDR